MITFHVSVRRLWRSTHSLNMQLGMQHLVQERWSRRHAERGKKTIEGRLRHWPSAPCFQQTRRSESRCIIGAQIEPLDPIGFCENAEVQGRESASGSEHREKQR
jgi:hypothetical protein